MTDGRKKICFETDLQFCPDCGTVLPNPNKRHQNVACIRCKFKIPISAFNGIEIHSTLTINKPLGKALSTLTSDDAAGPLVDRTCSKCGHEGMTFTTRQTRSADEGQTVFFGCPSCKEECRERYSQVIVKHVHQCQQGTRKSNIHDVGGYT